VNGGSRASKVINFVNLNMQRLTDIMANKLKKGLSRKGRRLFLDPVKKLSMQRTSHSCLSNLPHRWEPKNPAPPVTRTLFLP
jgi:hypothetical protein